MSLAENTRHAKQIEITRLSIFSRFEHMHFDDCVDKGLMTEEERRIEIVKLNNQITDQVARILLSKKSKNG